MQWSQILAALQNGVTAINNLSDAIGVTFPPITNPSTSAPTAGVISYSSSLVSGFATIQTSSGGAYKIALLPSS